MKNKKTIIALACVVCLGLAAVILLGGSRMPTPIATVEPGKDIQIITATPDPIVSGINDKVVIPTPIESPKSTQMLDPDPVIVPDIRDDDVSVSLTSPVTRPPDAVVDPDADVDERGEDDEPSAPSVPAVSSVPTEPSSQPSQQPFRISPTPQAPSQTPTPSAPSEPQSGDTNSQGQVWVPGFGWVTPGGDNEVIPGHSDGDINKQVGEM